MGSFLADSKNIRKRKKGSSVQDNQSEEKLEKNQDKGITMKIENFQGSKKPEVF